MKTIGLIVISCATTVCLASEWPSHLAGGPSCLRKCQALAHRVYRECRHNDGSEEQCRLAAESALERCVEENCHEAANCEARCQHNALNIYNACLADHGDAGACAARARTALLECLTGHCSIPDACEKRCEFLGHELARLCLAEGGSHMQCANQAHLFVDRCQQEHCPPCGGIMGTPCPKGEFCLFAPGTCDVADNAGVCVVPPDACPDIFDPVCGCDGVTYSNACEAAAAGVSIDHPSACYQSCSGIHDEPCPETHYCFRVGGGCPTPESPGICRPRPPSGLDCSGPVCGCDGNTYLNACDAAAAGTAFAFYGLCHENECYQHDPEACPEGSFCQFAPGQCDVDNNVGVCVGMPDDCSGDTSIVCGCDGVTYSRCGAAKAGVSIDHPGYCQDQYCGGDMNHPPCRPGAYCRFQDGECGHSDAPGICHVIPTTCHDTIDPVCGCDGSTHLNACDAARHGVSIDHAGCCGDTCGGWSPCECPAGTFCQFSTNDSCGWADASGTCAVIPASCTDVYDPVCGCDWTTYANPCRAAMHSVSIYHPGPCEMQSCSTDPTHMLDCPLGLFCQHMPGTCGGSGICMPQPFVCITVYDPVCGCDGLTYGNACVAAMAGVSVQYGGPCNP